MTELDRRKFLKTSAAVAAGTAIGAGPFQGLVGGVAHASHTVLVPVNDLRDGQPRLHVPPGFSYRSFHDTEYPEQSRLDNGKQIPGRHDGMAAFDGPGDDVILVRNHEIPGTGAAFDTNGSTYDPKARGGTTTVIVDQFGEPSSAIASLTGTMSNCSGGPMPWGAWVTCEETVNGPDIADDFTRNQAGNPPGDPAKPEGADPYEYFQNKGLEERHGYIFEVPIQGLSDGQPISGAGRFSHEAVAYDPKHGDLYLTEDDFGFPSGFYRYRPDRKTDKLGRLDTRGRLQMLAIKHQPNAHLEEQQVDGTTYEVEWVDIDQPDFDAGRPAEGQAPAMTNDEAIRFVASQGWAQKKGAAYFSRLEGAIYDNGTIYFTSTQGGGAPEPDPTAVTSPGGFGNGFGQVWGYDIAAKRLRVVYQSPGKPVLDLPDNITASPRGTLVLCEDNDAPNYVRGLSQPGHLFDIALNNLTGKSGNNRRGDEFAGSTFSPGGETLFVNIQASQGMSFAIWGPWESIGV
jgi:secreted PhoX family phosphatase